MFESSFLLLLADPLSKAAQPESHMHALAAPAAAATAAGSPGPTSLSNADMGAPAFGLLILGEICKLLVLLCPCKFTCSNIPLLKQINCQLCFLVYMQASMQAGKWCAVSAAGCDAACVCAWVHAHVRCWQWSCMPTLHGLWTCLDEFLLKVAGLQHQRPCLILQSFNGMHCAVCCCAALARSHNLQQFDHRHLKSDILSIAS